MKCELCGEREARVFMVVHDDGTAKAHVCLECFEELREVPGGTIESVSLQDYRETPEAGVEGRARGGCNLIRVNGQTRG